MENYDPKVIQRILDDAVAEGVAPGFQYVVFNCDTIIYNGVSGFATLPSKDSPGGEPFTPETCCWLASCAKLCVALVVLHILEKGLTKAGLSLEDLDNHEALVKYLPEFKLDSGTRPTKILEGFEDALGSDGRKVMKLRGAKTPITLRMLLTHTSGMAYGLNEPLIREMYEPSDGSVPTYKSQNETGDIEDMKLPLSVEPNTAWTYGFSSDWLAIFASRSTGRTFRQLCKDIILDPLHISSSELDFWLPQSRRETMANIYVRDGKGSFTQIPRITYYTDENEPPEGKATAYGGALFSTCQAYAKILQAVLNADSRILSKDTWRMAIRDDLGDRGIEIPRPLWKSPTSQLTSRIDEYSRSTAVQGGAGLNLLHCIVATAPTISGRSEGSFGWAGLANSYYFVDPVKGVGAVLTAQVFPFFEPRVIEIRDRLEMLMYKALA